MLNDRLGHLLRAPARLAALLALLGAALPVAAFAQNTFATLTGTVADPSDAVLPGASLVLTDTERRSRYEVLADRAGRFEFLGLPQGTYLLEAILPGFKITRDRVTLEGQDVLWNLKLELGPLQETVTVVEGAGGLGSGARITDRRPLSPCGAPTTDGIGGNIRQPRRLNDVRPQYPEQSGDERVEGLVTLDGIIGTDGFFRELKVVRSPHPELARAATEAISQWEFDETLLNCVPVEVEISVTVDFQSRP